MPIQRDKFALRLLTVTVFVLALAWLVWAAAHAGQPAPHFSVYLLMGSTLMAVGAIFPAPVPSRMPIRITLTPTMCLVCASALPLPWLILCTAVGVTSARLVTRHPRSAGLHKAVHNTSMDIVTAATAGLVMRVFGFRPGLATQGSDDLSLWHVIAFLVAAVAALLVQEVVTTAAVTWSTRRPFTVAVRYLWRTRLAVAVGEIVTAGLVAVIASFDNRALLALPVAVLVVHFAVTHRLRIREERRAWEKLAALGDALSARDLTVVLHTAAAGAVDLFNARSADIEITGGHRLVRANQQAGVARVVYDGRAAAAPALDESAAAVRHEIGGDAHGVHGVVRLYLSGPRDFLSVRERATLRAFAANLSSSIDIAHAYGLLASESRRHEAAATHDEDTGMLNRGALLNRLNEMAETPCHAVVIRLENYRFLAAASGKGPALSLLNALASRVCHLSTDESSAVARVGDETFALVMWGMSGDVAYQRACWAVAALRREVRVDERRLAVRASAGMASGPPGPGVLDAAELVLWRAIRRGQDRLVSYHAGPVREWSLARELSRARMSVSFEPVVDLFSGRITMVQSVPRWLYSRHDMLTADEYVYQLVDDSESLEALATQVVSRSMAAAATWRDVLPNAVMVVPVPAGALTPAFAEAVRDRLREHAAPGTSLVLALGGPPDPHGRDVSERIGQFGVRLLLDNYGSGHVGLESLNAATWSYLRLHPAYALDAGWRPAQSVIRAAVDLAADLDLAVIAPGITTEHERHELASLGCALGSGPLVGGEMFPGQIRTHIQLWQPTTLQPGAPVVRLHRAGRTTLPGHRRQ
ncbi:bifunctional diguanylate cyclase/phosphodiesterase [Micromonospora sp. CPCC 206060]|uniref:EAL domain-containing protein n=1 Tax=Micromonospora sp. CPCC 206060 TaxID=3122406 RepID=UPI002FF21D3F